MGGSGLDKASMWIWLPKAREFTRAATAEANSNSAPPDVEKTAFAFALVAFRGDATNTVFAFENKLHNLEAETLHVSQTQHDAAETRFRNRQLADLQFLPDGTAEAVHGTVLKQLKSLGISTWLDEDVIAAKPKEGEVLGRWSDS